MTHALRGMRPAAWSIAAASAALLAGPAWGQGTNGLLPGPISSRKASGGGGSKVPSGRYGTRKKRMSGPLRQPANRPCDGKRRDQKRRRKPDQERGGGDVQP